MPHHPSLSDLDPVESWQQFEPTNERPWTNRLAAHLFRRCEFGRTIEEIVAAQKAGPTATIESILLQATDATIDTDMASAGRLVTGGPDASQLSAWWLLRMVKSQSPFLEKMTLFWHGHFATGADKVLDARAMLRQNQLLRKHALGKFEPFVKAISRDVAMLIYLDSEENRRTRPNENYARELMELFCLGPGNYTESDIKEVARCFTGWEIRKGRYNFNEHQHDKQTKSFLGAVGNYGGDDAIEVVLRQPSSTQFIAKKLIRYFVFDDQEISDAFAAPIADRLRESGFEIGDAVKTILSSNVFYSDLSVGRKIKSPIELAIGFLRFFDASTNLSRLSQELDSLGQRPLYPPNVKGWAGGRSWINASTILARANLITGILANDKTKFSAGSLDAWSKSHPAFDVSGSLKGFEEFMLATDLPSETHDVYATIANGAKRSPDKVLGWLAALPEFQLN